MENWKEQILEAFKQGKTIQCNHNTKYWSNFIPQNQVDRPNLDYGTEENWRIKPDGGHIPLDMVDRMSTAASKERTGIPFPSQQKAKEKRDKKEITTLEEAAKKYATNPGMMSHVFEDKRQAFIDGAEWRAETSFSREEMLLFGGFCIGRRAIAPDISGSELWNEWIATFSKNG